MPPRDGTPADTPAPSPNADVTPAEFAATLRHLRIWSGLTQKALERQLALPDSTISDYERGVRFPPWEFVAPYVGACLAYREIIAKDRETELNMWHNTWRAIAMHATDKDQPHTVHNEQAGDTAQNGKQSRNRLWTLRRRLITGAAVLAAAIIAGGIAAATVYGRHKWHVDPSASLSPTVITQGRITNLGDKQGIDLDNGTISGQNEPGIDISFYGKANHIGAMHPTVQYAVLPGIVDTPRRSLCENVTGWTREYKGVHHLDVGRAICVRTDEGHLALMIITHKASNANPTLGLTYTTWESLIGEH